MAEEQEENALRDYEQKLDAKNFESIEQEALAYAKSLAAEEKPAPTDPDIDAVWPGVTPSEMDTPVKSTVEGLAKGAGIALENTMNFVVDAVDAIDNFASQNMGMDSSVIPDDQRFSFITQKFGEPKNAYEQGGRVIGQYLTPYIGVGKAVKATGAIGALKQAGLASTISAAIMDPGEERLADIIQSYPQLANPLAEWLASDEDDTAADARFKNFAESLLVDMTTGGLLGAGEMLFKALKVGRRFGRLKGALKGMKTKPPKETPPTGEVVQVKGQAELADFEVKMNEQLEEEIRSPKVIVEEEVAKELDETVPQYYKYYTNDPNAPKNMKELVPYLKARNEDITEETLWMYAKRGMVKDKEAKKIASRIWKNDKPRIEELINKNFAEGITVEEKEAMAMEYLQRQTEFESFVAGIDLDNITDAQRALFLERQENLLTVKARVDAGFSEAGRTLRAARYGTLLEDGDTAFKRKKMDAFIKAHGGVLTIDDQIKMHKQIMGSGLNFFDAFAYKTGHRFMKTMSDSMYEFWINNILSGVATLAITNPLSNVMQEGVNIAEMFAAEQWGKILGGKGVAAGETAAYLKAHVESYQEAFANAGQVWRGQVPGTRTKFFLDKRQAIKASRFGLDANTQLGSVVDAIGNTINIPTRILSAQDVFVTTIRERARLSAVIHRHAMHKGLVPDTKEYVEFVEKLKKNPSKGLLMDAEEFAKEHTLTTNLEKGGKIRKALASTQKTLEIYPLGKYHGSFMRVGSNLVDRGIQRIPILNFMRAESRAKIFSKLPALQEEELGKLTVGAGLLLAAGAAAHYGIITGEGPDDGKMRRALKDSGWQPNSLKLGDTWVRLETLGPMGVVAKIAADTSELMSRINSQNPEHVHLGDELFKGGVHILTNTITPDFLQRGVPEFFNTIKVASEGRLGTKNSIEGIGRFTTGFIPFSGAARNVGNIIDAPRSDTTPDFTYGYLSSLWQSIRNEWLEVIGFDGYAGLPPELNIYGDVVVAPTMVGLDSRSAIFSNHEYLNDPVNKELLRLKLTDPVTSILSPNQESLAIRMVERVKRRGYGDEGSTVPIHLDPWEYHNYVKLAAGLKVNGKRVNPMPLKKAWAEVMNSRRYKNAPTDDYRKKLIKDKYSEYKTRAWSYMKNTEGLLKDEFLPNVKERIERTYGKKRFGRGN